MEYKLEKGMEVYCNLHSKSVTHIIKNVHEESGWVELEDGFAWPIFSCFPKDSVTLPSEEDTKVIHELYG